VVIGGVTKLGLRREGLVNGILESGGQVRNAIAVRVESERDRDAVVGRIAVVQANDFVVSRGVDPSGRVS
jgi:hypothetical protein